MNPAEMTSSDRRASFQNAADDLSPDRKASEWRCGLTAGLPIALGYFPVSFGIGLLAFKSGMTLLQSVFLSIANLTSAGEAAGIPMIVSGASMLELILTQLIINLRYSLMALSLTQKLDHHFQTKQRLLISYGITDEIFAVAASRAQPLTPLYFYGMISIAGISWTLGTFFGALAGDLLPKKISDALGIMLYAMFLAIIIPNAKKQKSILFAVVISGSMKVMQTVLLPSFSSGFSVITCAVLSAVIAAIFFPHIPEAAASKTDSSIGRRPAEEILNHENDDLTEPINTRPYKTTSEQ